MESLPPRASLAMLIADARSREIRAVFPGAWRDQARAGALDLTMAVRSPGSALKPFIYAMAFADGIAAPDTVVPDLPRRFGGYAPENFDRGFAGSITAADALRRSLNLPAVALLDRVGPLRFAATLRAAGATLRLPHGADPSLPLALGGVGITLRQAAGLYAALATDGTGGPLRLLADQPDSRPDFLPTVAAHLVADVLTRPLPAFGPQGIAWKTGTSWGGRDAWAFGFDSRHVVAVWIGRPDGTPLPGATGTSLALPQLARVFDLLPKAPRTIQPPQAQHTRSADSGGRCAPPAVPAAWCGAVGGRTGDHPGHGRTPAAHLPDRRRAAAHRPRSAATWPGCQRAQASTVSPCWTLMGRPCGPLCRSAPARDAPHPARPDVARPGELRRCRPRRQTTPVGSVR